MIINGGIMRQWCLHSTQPGLPWWCEDWFYKGFHDRVGAQVVRENKNKNEYERDTIKKNDKSRYEMQTLIVTILVYGKFICYWVSQVFHIHAYNHNKLNI